jgi:hypothetical protein
MNTFWIDKENIFAVWTFISIEFLLVFGVWLIPTIYPTKQEFRYSNKLSRSVIAVIVMWVSAVLGYYVMYLILLAFVGIPHLESYLVFGQHSSGFWQDWAEVFHGLILLKFFRGAVVSVIVGGLAGFVTSSLYSLWMRKTNTILPA